MAYPFAGYPATSRRRRVHPTHGQGTEMTLADEAVLPLRNYVVPDGSEDLASQLSDDADDESECASTPFGDRFVMLPRDVVPGRQAGRRLRSRDLYLLIALYHLAYDKGRVLVTPERLSDLTGIPVASLPRMLGLESDDAQSSADFPLDRWILSARRHIEGRWGAARTRRWEIFLCPLDKTNFLRVPWWWLWTPDRERTTVGGRPWKPGDKAIFAALAIAHVGRNFTEATYGKAGLATVMRVSTTTMTDALNDAEAKGWISVDGEKGGEGRSGGKGLAARRRVNYCDAPRQ